MNGLISNDQGNNKIDEVKYLKADMLITSYIKGGPDMRRKCLVLAMSLLVALTMARGALAAQFQADMTIDGARQKATGKIFVKGDSMRQEMNTPMGKSFVVFDGAKDVMYVIMPDQKMYMEMPNDRQIILKESESIEEVLGDEAEVNKIGTETIEGYKCDKYNVKYRDPAMGNAVVWVSQKLNYPLKAVTKTSEGTITVIYTNINEGPVDSALFQIPSGYQKLSGF